MNLKGIFAMVASIATLVVPAVAGGQAVIRRGSYRTVTVRRPPRYVHRRAIVVRHDRRRHKPYVIVGRHRTTIIRH